MGYRGAVCRAGPAGRQAKANPSKERQQGKHTPAPSLPLPNYEKYTNPDKTGYFCFITDTFTISIQFTQYEII